MIGGGLPIGAVGGRREVMETLSPLGPVFHAGTLAGNPLATAAGLAALGELDARRLHRADRPGPGRLAVAAARRLRRRRLRRRSSRSSARCVGMYCGDVADAGRLRRRQAHRRGAPTRRSSTPCSPKAWPWRPAPTRRCSSGSATPTTCSSEIARRRRAGCPDGGRPRSYPATDVRQVLSWRFVMAIGAVAVAGDGARSSASVGSRSRRHRTIDGADGGDDPRRMDVDLARRGASRATGFAMSPTAPSAATLTLGVLERRT